MIFHQFYNSGHPFTLHQLCNILKLASIFLPFGRQKLFITEFCFLSSYIHRPTINIVRFMRTILSVEMLLFDDWIAGTFMANNNFAYVIFQKWLHKISTLFLSIFPFFHRILLVKQIFSYSKDCDICFEKKKKNFFNIMVCRSDVVHRFDGWISG